MDIHIFSGLALLDPPGTYIKECPISFSEGASGSTGHQKKTSLYQDGNWPLIANLLNQHRHVVHQESQRGAVARPASGGEFGAPPTTSMDSTPNRTRLPGTAGSYVVFGRQLPSPFSSATHPTVSFSTTSLADRRFHSTRHGRW